MVVHAWWARWLMRVYRVPDGGWVVDSEVVEAEPMIGYPLPEPAHRVVRLDAAGRAWEVTPHVWSDAEVLGCSVLAVRGAELVSTVWSRIDGPSPGRWDLVEATGLVEVAEAEFPYRAEVEAALKAC